MLVIGLISGTSADGVDAALVEIHGDRRRRAGFRLACRQWLTRPYPAWLRDKVLSVASGEPTTAGELCQLDFSLAKEFAAAVSDLAAAAGIRPAGVDLLGSHGQTVWHQPATGGAGCTLQLGQPQVIAELTGITTVGDFRPRDMAAGGQGAPLVPMADYLVFGDRRIGRVLLNIGGIANITVLPAAAGPESVVGFDTGPGNMLLDGVMAILGDREAAFDRDGRLAARGQTSPELLAELLAEPYYQRPPPKSTGRELFGRAYARRCLERGRELGLDDADVMATLTELTAATIANAVEPLALPGARLGEVVVAGGGAHNPILLQRLRDRLAPLGLALSTTASYGVSVDAREAIAFAVLAFLTVSGRAGNVPAATGAAHPVILGTVSPGRDGWRQVYRTRLEQG